MWIEELTPEQEKLIPTFRDKWIEIYFGTKPIDRSKASEVVKRLYKLISLKEPEIYFARSPYEALTMFIGQLDCPSEELNDSLSLQDLGQLSTKIYGNPLYMQLRNELISTLRDRVEQQVKSELISQIEEDLEDRRFGEIHVGIFKVEPMNLLQNKLYSNLINKMRKKNKILKFLLDYFLQREYLIYAARCLDFCVSVLHCDVEPERWEVLTSVLTECGWIYPFEKACFICDRPTEIGFDPVKLQVERKLTVKFRDRYGF